MERTDPVEKIMSAAVVTVSPNEEVLHAIRTMVERRLQAVPVVDNRGNVVGVLADRDCMSAEPDGLEPDDARHGLGQERLDVGPVGEARVGRARRRRHRRLRAPSARHGRPSGLPASRQPR